MVGAALERLPTAPAGEDEVDRGQHPLFLQLGHDVEEVIRGQGPEAVDPIGRLLLLRGFRPGPLLDAAVGPEEGVEAVLDREPEAQLDRPPVGVDGIDVTPVLGHPVGQLAVVPDRGRQPDQLDVRRRLDDDLLPDRAAREVVDVVDLVEDHVAHVAEPVGVLVDHVAEDLGRHHHDRSRVVDVVLAGHQADRFLAMDLLEVAELLVAERFQRRRVDNLNALREGPEDGVLGDHRLAARGGRTDENARAGVELVDRLLLEGVQGPGQ